MIQNKNQFVLKIVKYFPVKFEKLVEISDVQVLMDHNTWRDNTLSTDYFHRTSNGTQYLRDIRR